MTLNINLDPEQLRKYWLSAAAVCVGIWTSLNPTAQQQIIDFVAVHAHGHPTITFLIGLAALILADMKQSPITPKVQVPKVPVVEAPPYLNLKEPSNKGE